MAISSLSSSLQSTLLNPYAQQALQAAQAPAVNPTKPGTSINARYTVEEDGSLALREVSVNTPTKVDATADATSDQQRKARQNQDQRQREFTFGDIAKPKASISPADEVQLFAAATTQPQRLLAAPSQQSTAHTNPNITDVVLEEDQAPQPAKADSLQVQQQQKVARLYARNNDIVYNVTPAYSEAA